MKQHREVHIDIPIFDNLSDLALHALAKDGIEDAIILRGPWPEAPLGKPIEERIVLEGRTIPEVVKTFIVSVVNLPAAYAFLKRIRGVRDEWKGHMQPHIDGALEAKRVAEANRKRLVTDYETKDAPLALAERTFATAIGECEDAAERDRLAEQARLQAEKTVEATEKVLEQAIALIDEAQTAPPELATALTAVAEQLLDEPVPVATVSLPPIKPKKTGVSRPETWRAELFDIDALIKALADKKIEAVLTGELKARIAEAVMPPLNKRAAANKSAWSVPGVRAVSEKGHRMR